MEITEGPALGYCKNGKELIRQAPPFTWRGDSSGKTSREDREQLVPKSRHSILIGGYCLDWFHVPYCALDLTIDAFYFD